MTSSSELVSIYLWNALYLDLERNKDMKSKFHIICIIIFAICGQLLKFIAKETYLRFVGIGIRAKGIQSSVGKVANAGSRELRSRESLGFPEYGSWNSEQ